MQQRTTISFEWTHQPATIAFIRLCMTSGWTAVLVAWMTSFIVLTYHFTSGAYLNIMKDEHRILYVTPCTDYLTITGWGFCRFQIIRFGLSSRKRRDWRRLPTSWNFVAHKTELNGLFMCLINKRARKLWTCKTQAASQRSGTLWYARLG